MRTKLLLFLLLFPLTLYAQTLQNRVLKSSTFQVLGGHESGVSTGCATQYCSASVPLITPTSVVCPAPPGQTCTFAINVQATVGATPYDVGLFNYVGDGGYIASNTNPFYPWQLPASVSPNYVSASFTFVVTIKNTHANQSHPVEIDLGCDDGNGDGCAVVSESGDLYRPSASIRIDVLRP